MFFAETANAVSSIHITLEMEQDSLLWMSLPSQGSFL